MTESENNENLYNFHATFQFDKTDFNAFLLLAQQELDKAVVTPENDWIGNVVEKTERERDPPMFSFNIFEYHG